MGNRARYIARSADTTADTAFTLTTSVPVWARRSNPQTVTPTARRDDGPTGQPGRQLLPSSAVVTRRLLHANGGAATRPGTRTRCAGNLGAATGVVGVLAGDATVMDRLGAGEPDSCAPVVPLHAANVAATANAAAAVTIRCTRLA